MRHELIRAELARAGGVRIRDLVTSLGVSRATVRRDLHALVDAGEAVNARGGALLPADRAQGQAALERETIARAAAELITTGEVKNLGLFGGPLIHELARRLADQQQLHVVTNSLAVARILAEAPAVHARRSPESGPQVTLLGGTLGPAGTLLGHPAAASLATFRLDAVCFDCAGFDPRTGATTDDLYEADVRRAAVQISERAILLAERAQFGARSLATFATPDNIDSLIEAGPAANAAHTPRHRTYSPNNALAPQA